MKFAVILACIAYLATFVRGQYGFAGFSQFSGFGNGLDAPLQAIRDPRQNPGPVVFPPAPPDSGETSGVVVGASGYGFVPPQTSLIQSGFEDFNDKSFSAAKDPARNT